MAKAALNERRRRFLGKYEVLDHIASGGMAAVYKGLNTESGAAVALKVLLPELATRPNVLQRFRHEARHGARLRHENIVTVHEFVEAQETYFLVMEFVDGLNLHDHITAKRKLDPPEARDILGQVVAGLDYVHRQGIVHRDIKPSNILLTHKEGRTVVKLTDLGLAREVSEQEFRVTRDGTTVGTVDYLPPEQARDSRAADIRSDIYSLGCSLYHMLAGQPPFAEGSLAERILKHQQAAPPDLRLTNPKVSEGLWTVCRRMLAKDPDDRYQTPAELLDDLALLDRPGLSRPAVPGQTAEGRQASAAAADTAETSLSRSSFPFPRDGDSPGSLPGEDAGPAGPEQRQAARGQFQRAAQVIADGNHAYGIQLLLTSCRLDPANLVYRHALRQAQHEISLQRGRPRLRDWLATMLLKLRIWRARRRQQHWQVVQLAEEVLCRNPADIAVQLDMARAAASAGFSDLAVWVLEQAREIDHRNVPVNRTLALLCEKQGNFPRAISFWEVLAKADPNDFEARNKIRNLSARETIARGYTKERVEPGGFQGNK